jgi:hypothetical protein
VYPIPLEIARVTTPYAAGSQLDYRATVRDYLVWLREHSGDKPYFVALQGFSYDNLGSEGLNTPTQATRKPTKEELREMVHMASQEGASYIMWFGPSYLKEQHELEFWNDVLESSSYFSQ